MQVTPTTTATRNLDHYNNEQSMTLTLSWLIRANSWVFFNPFNAICSKLLLFGGSSAILV